MKIQNIFKRSRDPSWSALSSESTMADSGQFVDAKSAESITAVFGAVQALSESTATLPLHVYQRGDDGIRTRADDTALASVLRHPNPHQTGMAFREAMTASVLLHGNAYAQIEINGAGEVTALHPLHTQRMTLVKLVSGKHAWDYTDDQGKVQRFLTDEIFHLADRTEPGHILGRSRIQIARDQLGLALAQRAHGASVFRNGAWPSGVITMNKEARPLSEEQLSKIHSEWKRGFAGTRNAARTPVLSGGLEYKALTPVLEDLQWLDSMRFTVGEVARIFRVPPTMLQDLTNASYSNTAELGSQFVRYSLQRWISMWETEISRQLLGPIARRRYHAEHSVEGLLRGNPEARASFYVSAISSGWMTKDEVRALENLPPLKEQDHEEDPTDGT